VSENKKKKKRGLLRFVNVDSERHCFPHDWTRDRSLSYCLRYGVSPIDLNGREIDRRTVEVCAATALDLLQDLVTWPRAKRELFIRAIRREMAKP